MERARVDWPGGFTVVTQTGGRGLNILSGQNVLRFLEWGVRDFLLTAAMVIGKYC